MRYYSTKNSELNVSLYHAVTRSTAPDTGVYIPDSVPFIPKALFNNIADMTLTDIAYVVATSLFGSDIDAEKINDIVKETLTFDIPLIKIAPKIYALELFHGPTRTFKDIGTRFMAKLIESFHTEISKDVGMLNILVTTSGDTGCAVSEAFSNISGVRVFVLSPKGTLKHIYGDRVHSLASNIIPIEVRGDFDACVNMVKEAYDDPELNRSMALTSANSINIARLLPQIFFYFHAYARLVAAGENPEKIAVATPCGNLGNLTAALYAKQMGLPISRIMAAGHGHERLWGYISDGLGAIKGTDSKSTSSNIARINRIVTDSPELASIVSCHTYTETEMVEQIRLIHNKYGYLMERSSAMACKALMQNILPDETGVFMATAHPDVHTEKHTPTTDQHSHTLPIPKLSTLSPTYPALKKLLIEYSSNTKQII